MREEGRVIFTTRGGGMLVVQNSSGYALVELLGSEGEIEVGDIVSGYWNGLGGEPLYKDGEEFDAYFQGNFPSKQSAINVSRS